MKAEGVEMYDTLERLLTDRNVSKEMVSEAIEKPLNLVEDKMKRSTPWLWEECLTIQRTFFPDVDIVELFTYTDQGMGEPNG